MGKRIIFNDSIQKIINVFPFFVMFVDEDHTILLINTYAQTALGEKPEKILGQYCPNLIHKLDTPFPGCPLEESLEKGGCIEKELLDPFYNMWVLAGIYPTSFKTSAGKKTFMHVVRDISARKHAEEQLLKAKEDLEAKTRGLEESNIALKVLLEHLNREKEDIKNNILDNIKSLVLPYLEMLENSSSDSNAQALIHVVVTNLSEITKPFSKHLACKAICLSPIEVRVAKLVQEGKTAKNIANVLCISENTVKEHVSHIRRKLDLKKKKINLRTYLHTYFEE